MSNKTTFLTSAQQGVYIDCILDPENLQYNNPKAVSIPEGIGSADVAAAVKRAFELHPALFSHFENRDGRAVQVYADAYSAVVEVHKVDDAAHKAGKESFVCPFDLSRGPLYRAVVLDSPSGVELLMDFHHLVYDGSSLDILMDDICTILNGGEPSSEPNSYAGFAEAQSASATDNKAFYDRLLGGGITSTQLPADLTGQNGPHDETVRPVSAVDAIAKAKELGTAPSALFLAAAFYTIGRYTNSRELCLTTISNGRLNPLSEGVVGMFVNSLPLVSRIEDVSIREYIHGTRRMFQEVRSHEEYSFATIANDYGIEQLCRFTYQYGTLGKTYRIGGSPVKAEAMRKNSHTFPFTITIHNVNDRPAIVINYDTAMYSAVFAARFAESMDSVVSRFLENPDGRLLDVSIMSDRQKAEVESYRQTCIDPSAVRFPFFHNCIEYWAESTPDATAVIACDATLSYHSFNVRANMLAHSLIQKGVVPGDRICLLLPRRSSYLIAMFGVMKAGAAYIPCDPEYPTERIRLITEDSHARYVITTKDKMAEYGARALDVEQLLSDSGNEDWQQNPAIGLDSDSLAYLIYTSGSTGRPKGVMLRHTGICNYLTDHEENRHFHALVSGCKTMLCITTVSFDLSLKEIGASLYNGMTLVFADENQTSDPAALAALMEKTGVDGFSGTPSRLKMFLDLPDFRKALSKCKFIVLGGEKYPPTLLPQVKELAPTARLFNTYGPTEISVSCNGKELTHSGHITIGRPLLNVREYVVDEDLNELPAGVTGELLIGGLGVAAGYNDLPDKTAQAFIEYNGERCYKSGDYSYWNTDGEVVILGRKDNQIKLNGLRIELGEVEAVLCRQPQVKEGVAMIRTLEGHDHLVAYYTVKEKVSAETLKEQMGRSLTHYMVPTIFVEMEKMPVSPNGKTDLKALPQPVLTLSEEEKIMPGTAVEQDLYNIVAEILGNSNFGVTTNLISAGLTSLMSIQLSVFVNGRMNAILAVRDIMKYPTIRELAAKLQVKEDGDARKPQTAAVRRQPLSFSQLGVYSECVANPGDIQYNLPVCISMPQGVTTPQVKNALEKILEAHPYIGAHFQTDDNGDTWQCPMDEMKSELPVLTLTEQELEQEKKDFVRPFDLQEGPLYRFEIVETQSAVHLLCDFHHLIMDGASLNLFYRQLCLALDGSDLPKEEYDYYAFTADQKIDSGAEEYFAQRLSAVEEASALLPDIYGGDDSHRPAQIKVCADLGTVQAKCQELNITPASLYLAAVSYVVSRYTAEDTVGLCTISNGRSNLRISNTFGMFVNTLPLVNSVDSGMTVSDYLHRTAETFVDTLANENYPFSLIARKYGYAANIMYAYQVGVLDRYNCSKGYISIEKLALQRAKFPIAVFIEGSSESGGEIKVEYDGSLFSEAMMSGFAAAVRHVVSELLVRGRMSEVEICDEATLALLDSFNVKDTPLPANENAGETVLSLFRKAALQYPDNIAAVFRDKKYTYRELDALTDRIGGLIYSKVKDCGRQEPVVSILIPRNEYMFILPLAAMKAGCAYQPLDPSYPRERLNFMVKDADAALLIADDELRNLTDEYEGEVLLTGGLAETAAEEVPSDHLTPQSLFILLYTSGSTGVPKGVMLEHRNLVAFIGWYRRYYDLKPEHRVAAYASFGFDANMMDMYPALTTGASVHVIAEDLRLDLAALNDYFESNGITHSFITTQVGVQFLQNTRNRSLKHLSVGGEKLVSIDPPAEYIFHNGYGPTECTVFSTTMPVLGKEPNIPIGKPTDLLDCYIVDKNMHRLPVGAAGELIITGEQVGRGYLNRPEMTAQAFFTMNGRRAYHSGDIVRYRADGNIEFVGRRDGQVKIRGFRIELKEVEAVIREFAGIVDVTVQAFDKPDGSKFIAAYIVGDSEIDVNVLNEFILERKPPYMVPSVTMQIDRIPLNVNQKVNRKALPKPEPRQASAAQMASVPLNALETELKSIIASVVDTEDFSIVDVLGYVGLTSISSIKLAALVFKKYGVSLNSRELTRSGSLQSIENEILKKWMNGGTAVSSEDSGKPEENTEAPLTFPQQGVYMDCQMNPGTTMYNMPMMLEFPLGTSPRALEDAVRKVAGIHPSLFCNFFQTDSGVVMRSGDPLRFQVPVKTVTAGEIDAARKDFVRPFDLERDVLVRTEIYSVPEGPCHLFIDMHHLVADGASLNIFIKQVLSVLEGKEIEPEGCSYLEFAKNQNDKSSQDIKECKAFYDEMFAAYESAANVPADKTPAGDGLPQHVVTPIPEELLNPVLPKGVTAAHFWYAAFSYALSRFANTKDVYTAFISSGRHDITINDTVGMFVNTLPCAVHVKDQTVREFILEASEAFFGSMDHENYPFARIASDYDFKGCASYAYQMGVLSSYSVDGKEVIRSTSALSKAKIPFSIFIQNVGGVPCVDAEYDDSLYSRELALHFTESVVATAGHFLAGMDEKVKNISIMSERQRLEVEGMHSVNEDMSFPITTFHEGIEQWAQKTPDALALIACDREMTYREYNSEANRLARALIARGMQKGDRVVLLLPRRSFYLTSMFAVMKCGGAFIPMDPEYPADRIEYILDDSEGRFVITTADKVAGYPGRGVDIAQLLDEARTLPDGNLDVKVDPHDLAYLIYTSGSTGRPKGVMIEHLGAASFLTFYKSDTNFGSDSNANKFGLCQSTVSFDLSVGEIGVQVFNGDTVVFANEDEIMSPVEMVKLCRRTGTQTISGTPSRLAVNLEFEDYYNLVKDQMKCVVTGGEKLPGALLEELEKMDVYIINTYGPTETTMGSSAGVLNGSREIHVGKPFTNYTYQVLDSDRNELPVGVMGELCIGGIGLARGYNNMPERTAETFIEWQGKRIYRTGDYAMWTADGNIIIMGRTDNQVKLNGLRIELGEIETVMSQYPGMRQCVAVIKKLGNIDKLIGYYTVDETVANVPVQEYEDGLREVMSIRLTPYMVPGIFVRLDEMPLTPVGKTDVKRLPVPEFRSVGYEAPKNDVEKTFCNIFERILKVNRVGALDNFFEMGGTSLVAMQLIAEAAKEGYTMVYKNVFDNATPRLLARMLRPDLYDNESRSSNLPLIDEIENYDYSQLDDLLAANNIDTFRNGQCYGQMGDVFLTGATGYLGIHVLHNLILRDDVPHIYCLVRSGKSISAESRVRTLLYYYFGNTYEAQFGSRIFVIDGDVTKAEAFDRFDKHIDVLINCAANVKHFSTGTDIEDINIKGCQNCIDFCVRAGARFIQTSTGSVAGLTVSDSATAPHFLTEKDLYYGQQLTSKYTASKFLAERAVLDAVVNRGLKGKIMRLGNLSARSTDGEFQINFRSNNAMATLKAYQVLGCVPYERDCGYSEFSPINEVADAIVRLSLTPDGCTVFQPGNVHWPPYGDTIDCMNRIGIPIERVENEEFQRRLSEAMQDPQRSELVQSLIAYKEENDGKFRVANGWDTKTYTAQVLLRLGFRWSFTTWDYIENYLRCIQGLGVFDSDFKR